LRQPLSNFCRPHTDDGIIGGVVIGGAPKYFYADHMLTQVIQLTDQGTFYQQAKKVLAVFASGERIARNHKFERAANRIDLFTAELIRLFELMPG
jgi:hypothetical protein